MINKLVSVVLLSATMAGACPTGCELYGSVCACDIQAEKVPSFQPSDEKPPRSGMPPWQAEDLHVEMLPSCAAEDVKQDQAKVDADSVGKKAAGIQ